MIALKMVCPDCKVMYEKVLIVGLLLQVTYENDDLFSHCWDGSFQACPSNNTNIHSSLYHS